MRSSTRRLRLDEILGGAEKLDETATFAERSAALELLETHVFDRHDGIEIEPNSADIGARASALRTKLEAGNSALVTDLRAKIANGALRGTALRQVLLDQGGPPGAPRKYDALDSLLLGLLASRLDEAPKVSLAPNMVAFQPTPARAILDLVERADISASDRVCDLGSGFGAVPIFVSLLTGARGEGIEIEPTYCAAADASARFLGAEEARFTCGDLRSALLGDANVYFSYTPLRGRLLIELIARLRGEARTRAIRVCTLGPCTTVMAAASGFDRLGHGTIDEHEVTVFRSG